MNSQESLAALNWLIEAGADEALVDAPVNRFNARPAREEPKPAAPAPAPRPPTPSEGTRPLAAIKPTTLAPLATDGFGSAMELAARAQSLPELKAALEAFDGSQLKKLAKNTVFADGNPASRILFIGEAPGQDEDRAGLPFVGRAGKLLDRMMTAIHLDRTSAYIINVMPWRPPDNRNPDPGEVAICIPFLRRHIELAAPEMIVLLGAVSARHVLGLNDGIMKLRGRWLEYRVGEKMIPVLPTLHPAYLLRQPAHKKLAWRDLQAVAEKMELLGLPSNIRN
ncbi:MAG TPA: uracil-DNA glycosylase [Rhizomicrobium sp.]|nr:uracil-DNA glycosylase [Rhizomicrobium sp.]